MPHTVVRETIVSEHGPVPLQDHKAIGRVGDVELRSSQRRPNGDIALRKQYHLVCFINIVPGVFCHRYSMYSLKTHLIIIEHVIRVDNTKQRRADAAQDSLVISGCQCSNTPKYGQLPLKGRRARYVDDLVTNSPVVTVIKSARFVFQEAASITY